MRRRDRLELGEERERPSVSASSCFAIGAGLSGAAARIAARGPQMRRAGEEPDRDVLVTQADANLQRCPLWVKRLDKVRAPQE
jgi:hypothetical protein